MTHPQHTNPSAGVKSLLPKNTPSTSQVLAVVTLSGTLLFLTGITLIGTLIGLAALTIALAVIGFLGFRAFGMTGLSSLSPQINIENRLHVKEA
ncbi:oleosin H1-like [Apium graveolens]|uniref:oleosin H1-like n=1 Tax=Apium graveolens TaxID=4045 RepID=UPI003D7B2FB4